MFLFQTGTWFEWSKIAWYSDFGATHASGKKSNSTAGGTATTTAASQEYYRSDAIVRWFSSFQHKRGHVAWHL